MASVATTVRCNESCCVSFNGISETSVIGVDVFSPMQSVKTFNMVCGFKYRKFSLLSHMAAALEIHARSGNYID